MGNHIVSYESNYVFKYFGIIYLHSIILIELPILLRLKQKNYDSSFLSIYRELPECEHAFNYKVLKQIHLDTGTSNKAMEILNSPVLVVLIHCQCGICFFML